MFGFTQPESALPIIKDMQANENGLTYRYILFIRYNGIPLVYFEWFYKQVLSFLIAIYGCRFVSIDDLFSLVNVEFAIDLLSFPGPTFFTCHFLFVRAQK